MPLLTFFVILISFLMGMYRVHAHEDPQEEAFRQFNRAYPAPIVSHDDWYRWCDLDENDRAYYKSPLGYFLLNHMADFENALDSLGTRACLVPYSRVSVSGIVFSLPDFTVPVWEEEDVYTRSEEFESHAYGDTAEDDDAEEGEDGFWDEYAEDYESLDTRSYRSSSSDTEVV